jgi:hypothetical protein
VVPTPRTGLQTAVAGEAVALSDGAAVEAVAELWLARADGDAGRSAPPLPRAAPVRAWRCVAAGVVAGVAVVAPAGAGVGVVVVGVGVAVAGVVVAVVGVAVAVVGVAVVVVVAVAGVVVVVVGVGVVGVVVVTVGVDVVPVVVAATGATPGSAPRAVVPPPIQPFSAPETASVLARSDSRDRQRLLVRFGPRSTLGTLGPSPEA